VQPVGIRLRYAQELGNTQEKGGEGMKRMAVLAAVIMMAWNAQAQEFEIQSFHRNGELEFNQIPNAASYRVEWASSLQGEWKPFSELAALDNIVPTGEGNVIVTVPLFYRVVADTAPPDMVEVEGGTFTMGDTWGTGGSDEVPTHQVTLSSFWSSKYEVTNEKMREVMQWAYDNGKINVVVDTRVTNAVGDEQVLLFVNEWKMAITFADGTFAVEEGKENFPCPKVSWYGSAAFCNYRSGMEGLTPAYDLSDWSCNFGIDAYRLPTEAEWEYAARGGASGADTLYSGSDVIGDVAWYADDDGVVHEVGTKAPNELGIYDMSGNMYEWCYDQYGAYEADPQTNPTGPESGSGQVMRGGGYGHYAPRCRVTCRWKDSATTTTDGVGFRCVR